jgi:hypothetical protein
MPTPNASPVSTPNAPDVSNANTNSVSRRDFLRSAGALTAKAGLPMTTKSRLYEPGIGLGNDGWRVLTCDQLKALDEKDEFPAPDREIEFHLTGNMERWGINGVEFSDAEPVRIEHNERVRLTMVNDTMMTPPDAPARAVHGAGERARGAREQRRLRLRPAHLAMTKDSSQREGGSLWARRLREHAGFAERMAVIRLYNEDVFPLLFFTPYRTCAKRARHSGLASSLA